MKTGRNDPCPCGSGKKYKFCCLKKTDDTKLNQTPTVIFAPNGYEYCILFHDNLGEQDIPYDGNELVLKQVYHAIWYIMHLPRNIFDFLNINEWTEHPGKLNSHNIIFVPCSRVKDYYGFSFMLVIAETDCKVSAEILMRNNESEIGISYTDQLSGQLLRQQWKEIYNRIPADISDYLLKPSINKIELFEYDQKLGLTLLFMNNWLGTLEDCKGKLPLSLQEYYTEIFLLRHNMVLREYIAVNKIVNPSVRNLFESLLSYIQLPITLSLNEKGISDSKIETIELVSVHNAVANNGAYIEKEADLTRLFLEIRNIEIMLKEAAADNIREPRPYSIWKVLKRIGSMLYEMFSEEECAAIERSSKIVAFTDFPIGLVIFPNHSAPLCCYKKIVYRHLEPLTSTVIAEMSGHMIQDMTKGLKILMLECIDRDDPVRKSSDAELRKTLESLCKDRNDMWFEYREVLSAAEFYRCVNETGNIDILIISAHGFYDDKKYSGIYLGNEKLLNIEGIHNFPKLVMFSACHVCPRGNKAYSIVEQMVRAGVLAVLGTNVPVDVHRNAELFQRFIVAILSAQKGEYPFNNVLDIWQHIVSSNAVYEIKESNKRIKEWLDTKETMIAFQCNANEKGLRYTDTYLDTIDLLINMAEDDKLKINLQDIKREMNYFPESIFYELNGFPENIIVNENYNYLQDMYEKLHPVNQRTEDEFRARTF